MSPPWKVRLPVVERPLAPQSMYQSPTGTVVLPAGLQERPLAVQLVKPAGTPVPHAAISSLRCAGPGPGQPLPARQS
jgi:hypothetical protein